LELGLLQTCDISWDYDFLVGGWLKFKGGAVYNIKICKNDQQQQGHQARVGVPKDRSFDLLAQTREAIHLLCIQQGLNCDKRFDSAVPCLSYSQLFPRLIKKGTEFDLLRQATSPEISGMIVLGPAHVLSASTRLASPGFRHAAAGCPL
jgi:hypothetical protein